VLVVEDNPVNCLVIEAMLTQLQVRVSQRPDGLQALQFVTYGVTPPKNDDGQEEPPAVPDFGDTLRRNFDTFVAPDQKEAAFHEVSDVLERFRRARQAARSARSEGG